MLSTESKCALTSLSLSLSPIDSDIWEELLHVSQGRLLPVNEERCEVMLSNVPSHVTVNNTAATDIVTSSSTTTTTATTTVVLVLLVTYPLASSIAPFFLHAQKLTRINPSNIPKMKMLSKPNYKQ